MQRYIFAFLTIALSGVPLFAQDYHVTKALSVGALIEIKNLSGRVSIGVAADLGKPRDNRSSGQITISAASDKTVGETDIKFDIGERVSIQVAPADMTKIVNLSVTVPARSNVKVETLAGAVDISGNLQSIQVKTETGTVSTDIPDEAISYEFLWTSAKPRVIADFEIAEIKEGSGGKFTIKGRYPAKPKDQKKENRPQESNETALDVPAPTDTSQVDQIADERNLPKKKKEKRSEKDAIDTNRKDIDLRVTTARGIVLLNVDSSEVGSDLRERPLTTAAKAIIRSGDSFLMEAIRRASPKYFGDYMRTLPPPILEPRLTQKAGVTGVTGTETEVKTMLVSVTDIYNRSIGDLEAKDFEVVENGDQRDVMSVQPVTAPFNLVLLLDVSGSVDDYVNFIRKAARAFVETMGPQDRISIVTFNDEVHNISKFTTDKAALSESLDTFDAGGGTAYYDALAFVLAETLRPMRGDRTAIVVLTDGDDNRSFLPFDALKGTIQESGSLIYPMYVPSSLIAASATADGQANSVDWLRRKYMGLTTKAEGEGEKLARVSGGRYYPITQLGQIQSAYDDIAKQLRTAYSVTFRSSVANSGNGATPPRVRIKVKRENAFVKFANQ